MNKAASELGKLAAWKPKNFSAAEIKRRTARLLAGATAARKRKKRRRQNDKLSGANNLNQMTKTNAEGKPASAPVPGSASGPKTGYWLQHIKNDRPNGRFIFIHVGSTLETLLDTGSGVLVMKMLRRLKLTVPDLMGGPKCFKTDWLVRW